MLNEDGSYSLDQVGIRLVRERPLYSTDPINSPKAAILLMSDLLKDMDREMLCIVNLQTDLKPININIASIGSLNLSIAHPRELLKAAILSNSNSIMLFHNHPSGNPAPSLEDITLTERLSELCKLIGIPLTDHIIIGNGDSYYSFQEAGIMSLEKLRETKGDILKEAETVYRTDILSLRPMTEEERQYSYFQSSQIRSMTGSIGHLRADMGSDGNSFYSTWTDFRSDLKTPEFKEEFDRLINHFRFDESSGEAILKNLTALSKYCFSHPEATDSDFRDFFFRADTAERAYLLRLNPNRGEYNMYCYPYEKDWLERHLKEAQRGIRFIDSAYRDLFRLKDGGKVRITFPDGEIQERSCRYIDSTHLEYGSGPLSVFHIAEFAEWIEGAKAKVEPVNQSDIITQEKKKTREYSR